MTPLCQLTRTSHGWYGSELLVKIVNRVQFSKIQRTGILIMTPTMGVADCDGINSPEDGQKVP